MASVLDVMTAAGGLRDAIFDQVQTPGLPNYAFNALGAEHLKVIQAMKNFAASPKGGDPSNTYDPVVADLNAAAAAVSGLNPNDPGSLAGGLATSDAAVGALAGVTG
jgi:hypothetical protein